VLFAFVCPVHIVSIVYFAVIIRANKLYNTYTGS